MAKKSSGKSIVTGKKSSVSEKIIEKLKGYLGKGGKVDREMKKLVGKDAYDKYMSLEGLDRNADRFIEKRLTAKNKKNK